MIASILETLNFLKTCLTFFTSVTFNASPIKKLELIKEISALQLAQQVWSCWEPTYVANAAYWLPSTHIVYDYFDSGSILDVHLSWRWLALMICSRKVRIDMRSSRWWPWSPPPPLRHHFDLSLIHLVCFLRTIVWSSNSNLLLIFHPITTQLCNLDRNADGLKDG